MLIGQTIAARSSESAVVWTPWFAREGDAMTSTVDVIYITGDTELKVEVHHKDSSTAGDGTAKTKESGQDIFTQSEVDSFRTTGLLELVRYKITLSYTGMISPTNVSCHFRILNPAWETTGVQGV